MGIATHEWPRRLSVEQFYRMSEVGLFAPDERMELIEGEIIDMAPIGPGHASLVEGLAAALITELGRRAIVRPQLPVRLGSHSEPQPDIAVVAPRVDRYRSAHPTAADVLLLVGISRSTLRFDLDVKAPLYARHGIPELWIVDLNANEVHFRSGPRDGAYSGYDDRPRTARADRVSRRRHRSLAAHVIFAPCRKVQRDDDGQAVVLKEHHGVAC